MDHSILTHYGHKEILDERRLYITALKARCVPETSRVSTRGYSVTDTLSHPDLAWTKSDEVTTTVTLWRGRQVYPFT